MNPGQVRGPLFAGLGCPVCRARFRGMATCSRCGADLTRLAFLRARAYQLRQQAREELRAGELSRALGSAEEAQRLHRTSEGSLLESLSAVANGGALAD